MVLERQIDDKNRVTLPEEMLKKWEETVLIHPNYCAVVIRPKNVSIDDAIRSVEILLDDMRHQKELDEKEKKK